MRTSDGHHLPVPVFRARVDVVQDYRNEVARDGGSTPKKQREYVAGVPRWYNHEENT
jgi:hypothetical protein